MNRPAIILFRKGLRVFWGQEFMPTMRELKRIGRFALVEIKVLILLSWVVFPYCFLIAGLGNKEVQIHQFVYYGVAGILSQAIVVVIF